MDYHCPDIIIIDDMIKCYICVRNVRYVLTMRNYPALRASILQALDRCLAVVPSSLHAPTFLVPSLYSPASTRDINSMLFSSLSQIRCLKARQSTVFKDADVGKMQL